MEKQQFFKKKDLFIVAVLLIAALALGGFYLLTRDTGAKAQITVNGVKDQVISLSKDGTYHVDNGELPVTLEVKDGAIRFVDSKCPDHICEGFGFISQEGDYAVCMPAGVAVTIYK